MDLNDQIKKHQEELISMLKKNKDAQDNIHTHNQER